MQYTPSQQIGRTAAEEIAEKIGFKRNDPDFQKLVNCIRSGQSVDEIKQFVLARKVQDAFQLGR